jgi:hypothetical protein
MRASDGALVSYLGAIGVLLLVLLVLPPRRPDSEPLHVIMDNWLVRVEGDGKALFSFFVYAVWTAWFVVVGVKW